MLIPKLIKANEGFPESSYYLDVSNFLIQQAKLSIKDKHMRESRLKMLDTICEMLTFSLNLFQQDKQNYEPSQKQGFLERKLHVHEELKKLQIQHIKMLLKEMNMT